MQRLACRPNEHPAEGLQQLVAPVEAHMLHGCPGAWDAKGADVEAQASRVQACACTSVCMRVCARIHTAWVPKCLRGAKAAYADVELLGCRPVHTFRQAY
eukprot:664502-Pelagomonas_calceolata.AAC.5